MSSEVVVPHEGAPRASGGALATVIGVFVAVAALGVSSARLAERTRIESERREAIAMASLAASRLGGALAAMSAAAERVARTDGATPGVQGLALTPLSIGTIARSGDDRLDRRLNAANERVERALLAPASPSGLEPSVVVAARRSASDPWAGVALPVADLVDVGALDQLGAEGYDYLLRVEASGGQLEGVLLRSTSEALRLPERALVAAGAGTWTLELAPATGWGGAFAWWPTALTAILAAFISALFTHNLLRQPKYVSHRLEKRLQIARKANEDLLSELERRDEVERRLSFRAEHDELTGLPTRQPLLDRLGRALSRARTVEEYGVGLLVVGIDRFKYVNESLGREAGDEVLRAVAERLDRTLRPGDTLGRIGGDQFASVLYDVNDQGVAQAVAERVREAFSESLPISGQSVYVTVSVGIVLSLDGYDRPVDVLRRAETAMYVAKSEGRGSTAVYHPSVQDRAADVVHLEADIRRALEEDEFELVFQPIVELAKSRVAGAEVLMRWPHPLEGPISPGRFIPLAEESQLIVAIDRWVMERAARQMRLWRSSGEVPEDFYLSVNMSGRHLAEADLVDFVSGLVLEYEVPTGSIKLEVTEGVVMNQPQAALRVLDQIKAAGVPLLLDDFGTGYSSLSYLHRFPFDILKIDQSFVRRLTDDEQAVSVVQAIMALARTFGMKTVAEGAEEAVHVEILEGLGVTYVQGYHFARPLPPEDFVDFLSSFGSRTSAVA